MNTACWRRTVTSGASSQLNTVVEIGTFSLLREVAGTSKLLELSLDIGLEKCTS